MHLRFLITAGFAEKNMLLALGQLLFRGGVTVGICAIAALSISGFLSLIATNPQPKRQAVVETNAAGVACASGHCVPGTIRRRQVVTARSQ
jgi:threonine dehydrogenase-like Zn-dependent dehydrogenase